MIAKNMNLQRIYDTGVIAVVRAGSPEEALKIADAVLEGGIDLIEITFTVPGAVKVLEEINRVYSAGEVLLGAGTVMDSETARIAMLAGAEFIVGPNFNPDLIRMCNRYRKVSMPGCMSINEMVSALEAGADLIKLFPGSAFGPSFVKAVKGPLPQADIVPTGGVSLQNVQDWIANGCYAVGIGGELTKGASSGDFKLVTSTAKEFVEKVKAARSGS